MENTFAERMQALEERELCSPTGELNAEEYSELLSLYLLSNDPMNAKLLWGRIPTSTKASSMELKALWEVGKATLQSDQASIYRLVNTYQWSDCIRSNIIKYKEMTCQKYLSLVSYAYTVVEVKHLNLLLGLTDNETIELVKRKGWEVSDDQVFVKPKPIAGENKPPVDNKEHLERLTRYILFLET